MKKKLFSLLCTILMMAFFAPIAVPTFAATDYRIGENLIINGDFEEGLNGSQVPNGWSVYDTMTTSSVLVKGEDYKLTEDWKASGNTSYFVDKTKDTNNGTLYIYQVIPKEKLIPGASYVLHIEGRTQDGTDTTARYGMCLGSISDLGGAYNGGTHINYDVRPLNRTTQTNGEYWVHEGGFVYDGEKDIALSLWNQDRGKVWWDNISIYQVKRSLEGREDFQRYTADNFRSSLYAAGLIDNYTYVGTHIAREVESDGNVALRMKAKNGAIKAFHIKAKNHLGGVSAYKVNFRMKLLIPEGTQNAAETYTLGLYYTDGTSVYPQGIVVPTEQCKNKWFNVEVCFTEVNAGAPSMSIRQIDIATTPTAYAPDYLVDDISWGRMLISDMPRTKTIAYYTNFAAPQNGNTITWRISETTEASSFSTADTITSIGQFVPASAEDSAQMLTAIYRKDGEKMTLHKVTTSTFAAMTVTGKTDISLSGLAPGANYVLVNYLWDTDLKALIPDEVHHFAITETTA